MNRLSFFRLPLIFALFFVLFDNSLSIGTVVISMMKRADGYSDLWIYVLSSIPERLYYLIINGAFCIVISSIALYRINVHIVTRKNIILLAINAFIFATILYTISYNINNMSIAYYSSKDYIYNFEPSFFNIIVQPIFLALFRSLMICFILGVMINYAIKLLREQYEKAKVPFELTHHNSQKIHYSLFLLLFSFVYGTILSAFMLIVHSIMNKTSHLMMGMYLLYMGISIMAVYCKTKNNFTQPFVLLQSDRIVKSVSLINFVLFIFNLIYGTICFYCFMMVMLSIGRYSPNISMIIFCVLAILIQISFICWIVQSTTKRYFGRAAINGTI